MRSQPGSRRAASSVRRVSSRPVSRRSRPTSSPCPRRRRGEGVEGSILPSPPGDRPAPSPMEGVRLAITVAEGPAALDGAADAAAAPAAANGEASNGADGGSDAGEANGGWACGRRRAAGGCGRGGGAGDARGGLVCSSLGRGAPRITKMCLTEEGQRSASTVGRRRRSPLGWCGRHRRRRRRRAAPPVVGQAFCFLPLPTETGLPVHINGFFELSSNRRDILARPRHGRRQGSCALSGTSPPRGRGRSVVQPDAALRAWAGERARSLLCALARRAPRGAVGPAGGGGAPPAAPAAGAAFGARRWHVGGA